MLHLLHDQGHRNLHALEEVSAIKRYFIIGKFVDKRTGQLERVIGGAHLTAERAAELRTIGFKVLPAGQPK